MPEIDVYELIDSLGFCFKREITLFCLYDKRKMNEPVTCLCREKKDLLA